jgi:hypothetical protein
MAELRVARAREGVFAILAMLLGTAAGLAVLEIALNFLPVNSSLDIVPATAQAPVFHYEPNQSFIFSIGWDLKNVNRGHVNNAGFVNDQDYRKQAAKPLLAVVGDSFIEARMIPYPETLQGRLASALAGDFRVYSLAGGGAALSQYLIWAQHAVRDYGATALVINVVYNDFDESYVEYRQSPLYWVYAADQTGQLNLHLIEYRRSRFRALLSKSALARYLILNLRVEQTMRTLHLMRANPWGRAAMAAPGSAADAAVVDPQRMKISYAVIDAFFRDLRAMVDLPPDRVVFTMDGFHYPEAAAAGAGGYFDLMRRAFRAKAEALGYGFIDLDPLFLAHYRAHRETFEIPDDGHWTATAHAIAAEAVLASQFARRLRPPP